MERPLMQLLQALEGQMGAHADDDDEEEEEGAARSGQGSAGLDPMAAAMQQLASAFGVPMNQLQQGTRGHGHRPMFGLSNTAAAPPPPPADVRAPDPPPAAIEQLTAMGFSEPVVRKVRASQHKYYACCMSEHPCSVETQFADHLPSGYAVRNSDPNFWFVNLQQQLVDNCIMIMLPFVWR